MFRELAVRHVEQVFLVHVRPVEADLRQTSGREVEKVEPHAVAVAGRTVGGADEVAPFEPESLGGAAIDDHEAAILAALQIITAEELALIRERRLADGALSLANLSEMHRVATFKRALKISVRDLLDLLDLTGLNPFSAASPARCVKLAVQEFELTISLFTASTSQVGITP
jgi:hypothetical protein